MIEFKLEGELRHIGAERDGRAVGLYFYFENVEQAKQLMAQLEAAIDNGRISFDLQMMPTATEGVMQ